MPPDIVAGLAKPEYVLAVALIFGAGWLFKSIASSVLVILTEKLDKMVQGLGDIKAEIAEVRVAISGL